MENHFGSVMIPFAVSKFSVNLDSTKNKKLSMQKFKKRKDFIDMVVSLLQDT